MHSVGKAGNGVEPPTSAEVERALLPRDTAMFCRSGIDSWSVKGMGGSSGSAFRSEADQRLALPAGLASALK